ncbi:MAG: hypothetical protein QOE45_2299 [Frankiaceae bacterium]|jgi:hypothetical protein|nr:hypothetical protein [Frankiaceae bacterium]
MRVLAAVAAAVTVASLASGGAAYAAAKPPICNQVTDDRNDAVLGGSTNPAGQPSSSSLDVLGGDIATGKKNLVATVRIRTLDRDTWTTPGATYVILWVSNGVKRSLAYRLYGDGTAPDAVFDTDTSTGQLTDLIPVSFRVTPQAGEVTFTMPRRLEPSLKKTGVAFTGLEVQANNGVNRKNQIGQTRWDTATSPRRYVDGTPTCLKGT